MMQMAMSAVRPITIALVLALACAVRVQAQRLDPVSYPLRAARSHTSEDVSAILSTTDGSWHSSTSVVRQLRGIA